MGKFIWTVAHNTLSNYYRDTAKSMIGVSIDEIAELIADPDSELEIDDNTETIRRLQTEIAYLSKLQRRIVIAYYFENRKQADIATELGVPLSGTMTRMTAIRERTSTVRASSVCLLILRLVKSSASS